MVNPITQPLTTNFAEQLQAGERLAAEKKPENTELRKAFDQFVGETFFGMMLKTMRESTGETPYFHGGRAEEIFQGQMDQLLVERMTQASAEKFTGPMFELFNLNRR